MTVFGTRPEGIKMMPVVRELRTRSGIEQIVCVTGQHRHLLDQVFSAFGEQPDIDLQLMSPGQTLSDITARIVIGMSETLARERPDVVLVHGDTTTAMATALAAFYAHVPIGHVEAGLRSFDFRQPWPEEFNRVTIDSVASLLFAPTERSASNLKQEYNCRGCVVVTGNTGIDALLYVAAMQAKQPRVTGELAAHYPFLDSNRRLILVTGHRRESFGAGFQRICDGLMQVAARGDVQLVYPLHLNPNVQEVIRSRLSGLPNVHLIAPVDYLDMVYLMQRAAVLITDSGGVQEEGPALGKPVLVMREVTERPEALASGGARLIGTDPRLMLAEVDLLLDDPEEYRRRAQQRFPFGDGTAAAKIVDAIEAARFP
ncbi:MAG: UDP-N-acetylglucosamine 2-epimerase (non-hydrolyzing) [Pseudomonadota bacterium]|nr:UDP-N-acetylglucosamine 2-epimerase (non-hydrolyzing) [Pseudomonadota bacterium]